jgi:type II secretory pathway component GspD/PulD (secretin)
MKITLIMITRVAMVMAMLANVVGSAARAADQDADHVVPLIVIEDVPLPDAIRNLARQMNLNFILDPRVPGSTFGPGRSLPKPNVSGRWPNATARAALESLLKDHKLLMVTNPATTIARIAPMSAGIKPVPANQVRADTNGAVPLLVMEDVPLATAIKNLASHAHLKISLDDRLSAPEFDQQGTVSLRWERVTTTQALAALLDNYDLIMTDDPATSSVRITTKKK